MVIKPKVKMIIVPQHQQNSRSALTAATFGDLQDGLSVNLLHKEEKSLKQKRKSRAVM